MSLFKLPQMPRFDPESDGNPFAWIVANAPKARAARAAAQLMQRATLNPPVRYVNPHAQATDQAGRQKDGPTSEG